MLDDITHFLQSGGGWGITSGPGLIMVRVITRGVISATASGLMGASIAALMYDTATIPFIFSASTGFVLACVGFYRDALRKSLRALDKYPRLLQLHLNANFSHRGFDEWDVRDLRSEMFRKDWKMQSMLIAAWMTAVPAMDRIREAQEEMLVQEYASVEVEEEKSAVDV